MKPRVVFLVGATASGKSGLAMAAAATNPKIEIISVDSAQVYSEMNVGTAKPTLPERAAVPHHLIDVMPPTAQWSVKQYCDAFNAALSDIHARGKTPLAVGGTMMYVSALLDGLSEIPSAQIALREEIAVRAARDGWPALHAELTKVDPITAQRLPATDAQRISRALEVWHATGTQLSALQGHRTPQLSPDFDAHIVSLEVADRAVLHARIAARFDAMLDGGLIEEVEYLRRRYETLTPEHPSMRCVGYRQTWQFLEGEITHAQLRETGVAATRQLAKRQMTWQRHQFATHAPTILAPDAADALAQLEIVLNA